MRHACKRRLVSSNQRLDRIANDLRKRRSLLPELLRGGVPAS